MRVLYVLVCNNFFHIIVLDAINKFATLCYWDKDISDLELSNKEKTKTGVTINFYIGSFHTLKLLPLTFHNIFMNVWWRYNVSNVKIFKESFKLEKPYVTRSYIWYISISKCVYLLDTICEEIQKTQLTTDRILGQV